MILLTRRRFLQASAATLAVAALDTGCSSKNAGPSARPTPAGPASGQAYLGVARGADPAANVRAALAALGGIERFVRSGSQVIVKPNICVDYHGPEYAATTNPAIVGEIVRLCLGAGAKRVRVMDTPLGGTAQSAYGVSGIGAAVRDAGGEMEIMSPARFGRVTIAGGRDLKAWEVYPDVLAADVLIDVPIAKHHSLARLSLGCKNLLGVARNVNQLHQNLGQRVADLLSVLQPTLSVVDATRILVAHGPTGGSLSDVKQTETVIASHDTVAADAYAATLFDLQGGDVPYLRAAADMGLGTIDLGGIKIEEVHA